MHLIGFPSFGTGCRCGYRDRAYGCLTLRVPSLVVWCGDGMGFEWELCLALLLIEGLDDILGLVVLVARMGRDRYFVCDVAL